MKSFKDMIEYSDLNEGIGAKEVYDYYQSTFEGILKATNFMLEEKGRLDKMNRRILSDYAGNPSKLKDIYTQIHEIANSFDKEISKLESIVG